MALVDAARRSIHHVMPRVTSFSFPLSARSSSHPLGLLLLPFFQPLVLVLSFSVSIIVWFHDSLSLSVSSFLFWCSRFHQPLGSIFLPTRLSSRFSTPFLFSGNLAVFFIFWSVLSLALSPPNCSQPVSFSFRPELSLFFLPLFNPPPLTPCPFHRFFLSYASGSSLLASTSSNLFVFSLSCFHSCFVLYSSLSRPTPSDARAPFLHSLLVQQSWSSCSSIHNIRYLSLPILVVVLQCTSWKIFEIIIFFIS